MPEQKPRMKLFRTIKMESMFSGVFIVNPSDPDDRYLVTSPFDKNQDAEQLATEFNRIAEAWSNFPARAVKFDDLNASRAINLGDDPDS